VPAVLLGAGLGGLLTDIVFLQLLQAHHFLSARVPAVDEASRQLNVRADGVVQLLTLGLAVAGLVLLVRRARAGVLASRVALLGGGLLGWGVYTLFDALVDHGALGLHHLVEGPYATVSDVAYLGAGALLAVGGALLLRRAD
jgi:uncharacterized membrane protein